MQLYLNTIYFGRGAYGIEAAAQAYFGKDVDKLTRGRGRGAGRGDQAAGAGRGDRHKGFDPALNPKRRKERWDYVLDGMVEKGWLTAAERPTEYPEVVSRRRTAPATPTAASTRRAAT